MIFTLPNLVSFVRLSLIPVFLWLLFGRDDPTAAGLLLGVIGGTDWVDGYLARRLNQVSELGKFLDPLADRLAVATAVIGGWMWGAVPGWFALPLIAREALIAAGALVVGIRVKGKLDVRYVGKLATFLVYFAVPAFLVHEGTGLDFWQWFAVAIGSVGLTLYWYAAALYLGDMRELLRQGGSAVISSDGQTGDHR